MGRCRPLPLWIADQVRNDGGLCCPHPVDSCLRGNDGRLRMLTHTLR